MRKKMLLVGTVAAGLLTAASAVSANAIVRPAHPAPVLHGSLSGGGIRGKANPAYPCFYQGPDGSGNAIVSTDLGPGNPLSSTGADDFSVTAPCMANTVTAWGQYGGAGAATQVEVDLYQDAGGGLPASTPFAQTITGTFSDSSGFLTIPITPVSLLANTTYWVSVQAQNVSSGDVWYWDTAAIQGNPAVWQNPAGGFGTSCTTWAPLLGCVGVNADFAFIISAAGPSPCYSQTASSYPSLPVNSQDWGPVGAGKKDLAADDFTLTGFCKAHSVIVPFRYLKTGTVATLNVRFCKDTGVGYPVLSGSLCTSRSAAPSILPPGTDMVVSWPNGVAMVPGNYWIVIRAQGATTWGLWGWDTMPQVGQPAVWRNGGWWPGGCTAPAFYNLAGCNPGADADLAFTIIN